MKPNTSGIDRVIRILLAVVLVILGWKGMVHGTWAMVLYILAAVLLLTALVGFCPIYRVFGIRTTKKQEPAG